MGPALIVLGLIILVVALEIPIASLGVVAFVFAAFVLWRLSLALWPMKKCRNCDGMGSHRGPLGFRRPCEVCEGAGMILRIGAQ